MHSLNTEGNEQGGGALGGGIGGGGAPGGRAWSSYVPVVAAAALGLKMYWMIRDIRKKNDELQMKIRRNQLYIERNNRIETFYSKWTGNNYMGCHDESLNRIVWLNKQALGLFSLLNEVEDLFVQRQHIFCSRFKPKSHRLELEKQIRNKVEYIATSIYTQHIDGERVVPTALPYSFDKVMEEDVSCGSCLTYMWTGDKRRNGGPVRDFLRNMRREMNRCLKEREIDLLKVDEDSG